MTAMSVPPRIANPVHHPHDEVGGVKLQRCRDLQNVDQRRVDFAPLHVTHIGPVQPRCLAQVFLADPQFQAPFSDPLAEVLTLFRPSA